MNVYDFSARTIQGQNKALSDFKGQVLLIVNTAGRCGFTPQYKGLQSLYDKYKDRGFVVLAFPCNQFLNQEPGTPGDIQSFCELNFGVTFPLFDKIDVNGRNAHPLFSYLTSAARGFFGSKSIKWNFTKFLIDRGGNAVKRYAPVTPPEKIMTAAEILLGKGKK